MLNQAGAVFDLLMGRKSSRRLRVGSSRQRSAERAAAEAARKVEREKDDLAQVEEDLVDDIDEIRLAWSEKAVAIEPVEIGLERDDVAVDEVKLVWIPVAKG